MIIFLIFYFYIYPSLSLSFSSQVVFARRYCLDVIGWGPVVFSGCTLVSDNTTSFQVITLRLSNASSVSAAQERETQIASEVSRSFAFCIKWCIVINVLQYIFLTIHYKSEYLFSFSLSWTVLLVLVILIYSQPQSPNTILCQVLWLLLLKLTMTLATWPPLILHLWVVVKERRVRKRREIVCVIDDEYGEGQEWKKREWGSGLTVCMYNSLLFRCQV